MDCSSDRGNYLLDAAAVEALLALPRIDGQFEGPQAAFLKHQGQRRPLVLFAFAPRSAGTFLRTAAIVAAGGQLLRVVQAEGGRDATLYLPLLLTYLAGGAIADTAVSHVHMQACQANRHLMDALDLRPIIMRRSIPAMLASLIAFLDSDEPVPLGFSLLLPENFRGLTDEAKADLVVTAMAPWYVQYFAGWKSYADSDPGRVCVLDYDSFVEDPAETLELALAHARLPQSYRRCEDAIATVWQERQRFRCHHGDPGRIARPLSREQRERVAQLLGFYRHLSPWADVLLGSDPA